MIEQLWAVFNIGCIECGVSSNLVGVFDDEQKADAIAGQLNVSADWREGGENGYEVFQIGPLNVIHDEYLKYLNEVQPCL